ncbi:hypothetical protein PCANC_00179 [Puccinia coronata f. sp. avenae]|uniref:Uncharacterized protein n=1 Tax=Puccinia coronata f. sp. avenae TaxID=200324 RepID=A0A2N5SZZ8_9BASI|nr:hypothetical protein PCANC_06625 [Puccinia coronata f. sp. avenae]PLW33691.1 hypothetical protein PCASD_10294 [Puccinia coronata f. sp. avenae]PLW58658.1 hypothetical protein PCANC_00179 [Puccinia coronata f. sp. avenae]
MAVRAMLDPSCSTGHRTGGSDRWSCQPVGQACPISAVRPVASQPGRSDGAVRPAGETWEAEAAPANFQSSPELNRLMLAEGLSETATTLP